MSRKLLFILLCFICLPIYPQTIYWAGADFPTLQSPRKDDRGNSVTSHPEEWNTDVHHNNLMSRRNEVIISDFYKEFTSNEIIPLLEIPTHFCPELKGGTFLFMINKHFITKNPERYKIDKAYIYKVEILKSEELLPLRKLIKNPFTVVRIFTKTPHNWHPLDTPKVLADSLYPTCTEWKANHQLEYLSDAEFNDFSQGIWCYMYNGEYLGPRGRLCVDVDKDIRQPLDYPFTVKGLGMTVTENWESQTGKYSAYGKPIRGFTNFTSGKREKKLLTLEQVKDKYCSHIKEQTVLFMINKFFITRDVHRYKIEEDFVYNVETLQAKDIPELKGLVKPPFAIIRIFTRTTHNWRPREVN